MKRLFSLVLMILMLTSLAAPAAAQMNYNLPSPHITYTHTGESGMPELVDTLGDGDALVGDALALGGHRLGAGLGGYDRLGAVGVGVVGRALEVVLGGDDAVHRLLDLLR